MSKIKYGITKSVTLSWKHIDDMIEAGASKEEVEQAVKNAIEALDRIHSPFIELKAFTDPEHRTILHIEDNGHGIPEKYLEQVFVPFFTTREHGSGIGLSLSKQIMRLHKGDIFLFSEEGKGTRVVLKF